MYALELRAEGAAGDGEGNDADVIQRTLDKAHDLGARVRVTQGRYLLGYPVTVKSNVTIDWDNDAYFIAKRDFIRGNEDVEAAMLIIDGDNITLQNPRLDGNLSNNKKANDPGFFGVYGVGVRNLSIFGGHIKEMPCRRRSSGTVDRDHGGEGIYLGGAKVCDHCIVRDCWVQGCERNGIGITSATRTYVSGLLIEDCGNAGIDVEPDRASQRISALRISNCVVRRNAGNGLLFLCAGGLGPSLSADTIVFGNEVEANGGGVAVGNFAPLTLCGNTVRNNAAYGVRIEAPATVVAVGNILHDNAGGNLIDLGATTVISCGNYGI